MEASLFRHDGSADRGLEEATRLARELRAVARVPPAALARLGPRVAIVHAYEDAWAIEIDPHQAGLTHRALVQPVHAAIRRLGTDADIIDPPNDLTGYDTIVAPALHLMSRARVDRLRDAMAAGALVILGPRALVKDLDDCWLEEPLPGGLATTLGARVVEGLSQTLPVTVEPSGAPAGPWTDVLEVDDPQDPDVDILATYGGPSYLTGRPAAVRRGRLAYVGSSSVEAWTDILGPLLAERGLPVLPPVAGLERFVRGSTIVALDHASLAVSGLDLSD